MKCKRCKQTPKFHSFDYLKTIGDIDYYYCFPADNKESVQTSEDMQNFCSHFPTDRKWSVVFHLNGYGLANLMPLPVALEMGKLVQDKHLHTLQKVYIVQGSWFMQFIMTCILPFLQTDIREKFVVLNGSFLEVMMALKEKGLAFQDMKDLRNNF
jgi:hypothetical protein